MDEIARASTRIMFPIIMMVGLAVALHGHLSPGGGFAGGVIMASAFLLVFLTMRENVAREIFVEKEFSFLETFGGFVILLILLIGATFRAKILQSQHIMSFWSGEYTLLMNFAGSMMVTTALVIILWRYVR